MNCLEARRLLLADPHCDNATLSQHLQACENCHAFSVELHQNENTLRQALEVTVPNQLAERILLNNQLRQRRWQRPTLSAAAVLIVMIGIGSYLFPSRDIPATWNEIVLAHVLNEPETLTHRNQIPAAKLRAALAEFGLTMSADIGEVSYLDRCDMPGGKGLHVVINTAEMGQVTLILPPLGTSINGGQSQRDGFTSTLVDVGNTSVGLVTTQPTHAKSIHHWLRTKISAT